MAAQALLGEVQSNPLGAVERVLHALHAEEQGVWLAVLGGAGAVQVTPGLHDENAVHAYRHGHCVALALCLHERTGWPLVGQFRNIDTFAWEEQARLLGYGDAGAQRFIFDLVHCFTETPDGLLLDIEGSHAPETVAREALEIIGTCALAQVDPDALRAAHAWASNARMTPPLDLATAQSFVPGLLAGLPAALAA